MFQTFINWIFQLAFHHCLELFHANLCVIFEKLDEVKVFHGDSNILNYMIKNDKVYIIDFGFSREITDRLVKKLGTDTPNTNIMTLGLILKLKELNCDPFSWKYLMKKLSKEEIKKFQL